MSKLSLVIAACVTLLASSTGMAAFEINDPAKVTVNAPDAARVVSLGEFQASGIQVNRFDTSGKLVTGSNGFSPPTPSNYVDTLGLGRYEVFLINGRNSTAGETGTFSVQFNHSVAGVIASNAFSFSGLDNLARQAVNVWGNLNHAGIIAAIQTALADTTNFNPNIGSSGNRATTLDDLQNNMNGTTAPDTRRAIEVNGPPDANNPDEIQIELAGNRLDYRVGTKLWGSEMSLVFVAVPEPTTLAVWGLCAVGAVVAGRRRMRRLAA